jgi:hypothetical protein
MLQARDAERVGQLRKMLVEARKRKLSEGLAARRKRHHCSAIGAPSPESEEGIGSDDE